MDEAVGYRSASGSAWVDSQAQALRWRQAESALVQAVALAVAATSSIASICAPSAAQRRVNPAGLRQQRVDEYANSN